MGLFVIFITLVHTLVSSYRLKYGLCSLLLIKILIPDAARSFIPALSLNSLCSLILFIILFWNLLNGTVTKSYLNNKLVKYIFVFYLFSWIFIFFSMVPITQQVISLHNFFVVQLLPIICAIVIIQKEEDLILVLKVYVIALLICSSYALFAWIVKDYSYNDIFVSYFGYARDANMDNAATAIQAGIVGRVIGTTSGDSYSYGMIVPVAFLFMWILNKKLKWKITIVGVVVLGLNVLLTVRRTPIITCMSFFLVLFLLTSLKNKFKYIALGFLGLLLMIICINYIPFFNQFQGILESSIFFWDESVSRMNEVEGSSVSLRRYQFFYTLDQIKDSFLFGNGWGSMYYKAQHPTMFGWESIVFTTLMQFGYLGTILWAFLFWQMYKYSVNQSKNNHYQIAFIFASLTLWVFTDTMYHAYTFLGCVFMGKFYLLNENTK